MWALGCTFDRVGSVQSTHRVHHVVPLKHSLDNFFTPQLMQRVYIFLWKCIMYIKTPYLIYFFIYWVNEWIEIFLVFLLLRLLVFHSLGAACACLPCSRYSFLFYFFADFLKQRIILFFCVLLLPFFSACRYSFVTISSAYTYLYWEGLTHSTGFR